MIIRGIFGKDSKKATLSCEIDPLSFRLSQESSEDEFWWEVKLERIYQKDRATPHTLHLPELDLFLQLTTSVLERKVETLFYTTKGQVFEQMEVLEPPFQAFLETLPPVLKAKLKGMPLIRQLHFWLMTTPEKILWLSPNTCRLISIEAPEDINEIPEDVPFLNTVYHRRPELSSLVSHVSIRWVRQVQGISSATMALLSGMEKPFARSQLDKIQSQWFFKGQRLNPSGYWVVSAGLYPTDIGNGGGVLPSLVLGYQYREKREENLTLSQELGAEEQLSEKEQSYILTLPLLTPPPFWAPHTPYVKGFEVRYGGAVWQAKKEHNSSSTFDQDRSVLWETKGAESPYFQALTRTRYLETEEGQQLIHLLKRQQMVQVLRDKGGPQMHFETTYNIAQLQFFQENSFVSFGGKVYRVENVSVILQSQPIHRKISLTLTEWTKVRERAQKRYEQVSGGSLSYGHEEVFEPDVVEAGEAGAPLVLEEVEELPVFSPHCRRARIYDAGRKRGWAIDLDLPPLRPAVGAKRAYSLHERGLGEGDGAA